MGFFIICHFGVLWKGIYFCTFLWRQKRIYFHTFGTKSIKSFRGEPNSLTTRFASLCTVYHFHSNSVSPPNPHMYCLSPNISYFLVSIFASFFGELCESVDEIFGEIWNCLSVMKWSEFFKFPKMSRIQIPKWTNERRTFGTFSYESTLERKLVTNVYSRENK